MSDADILTRAGAALAVATVAIAVVVACVYLSIELRWVAPIWVPWALVALSLGLGLLLARAAMGPRAAREAGAAVFVAELRALEHVTGRLDRLLERGTAAELPGAKDQLAPGMADLLRQSEQTAAALGELDGARRRFAQELAAMVCGLELLEVALRHSNGVPTQLEIPRFREQAGVPDV